MKIALIPFNPVVGDIYNNIKKMGGILKRLCDENIDLAVFPELSVCGYPPRDLLDKPAFIADNKKAVAELAKKNPRIKIIAGCIDTNDQNKIFNSAAYLDGGIIKKIAHKTLLPTYDVFDEDRYFSPSKTVTHITLGDKKFGITICEDLWFSHFPKYKTDPVKKLVEQGVDYLINISASPFEEGKLSTRLDLIKSTAKNNNIPLFYVNQSGGNDGIIFDGGAVFADNNGYLRALSPRFNETPLIIDTNSIPPTIETPVPDYRKEIIEALALGVRDYTRKTGFKKVLLGLSGGIDSALTAALAVKALGNDNVVGVSMPSRFSSQGSITDAEKLAENLNIELLHVPIKPMFDSFLENLAPHFKGKNWDLTEENLQARIRGCILMALSNKHGYLLLTTGNKSELAVGYCTLYGDMCGGLAVISDVFKTKVYEVSKYINRSKEIIPADSITKPPSAELRHDQTDQDTLPEYHILDGILKLYIEEHKGLDEITKAGFDKETVYKVIQLVDRTEYKRKQAACGLKISKKAFGEGRRIPIVQNYVPLDHCDI